MSYKLYTGKTEASYYHGHRLRRPAAARKGRGRGGAGSYPVGRWRCDADDDDEEVDLVARDVERADICIRGTYGPVPSIWPTGLSSRLAVLSLVPPVNILTLLITPLHSDKKKNVLPLSITH